jgi:hypothetical protein
MLLRMSVELVDEERGRHPPEPSSPPHPSPLVPPV